MKRLKKIIYIVLAIWIFFTPEVLATNTKSVDIEKDSSQGMTAADSASLSITGDISIEFWANFESATTFVITKYDAEGQYAYVLRLEADRSNINMSYSGSGSSATSARTEKGSTLSPAPGLGEWHHYAVTIDVSSQTYAIYLDGTSKTVDYAPRVNASAIANTTSVLGIGNYWYGGVSDTPADGKFDEVRIWNDIRSSAEITANMSTELVGDEAGLAAYWKFNEAGGGEGLVDSQTSGLNPLTNRNSCVFSTDIPFPTSTAATPAKNEDIIIFE